MIDRKQIEEPVAVEFKHFNEDFDTSLRSQTALLESAIEKVMASTGKHIRPLLLLLTAKSCGTVTENSINSAVLIELLHTATLIHDDVIDETKIRRGVPSLNAIYDNRISVLVGDYILSSALVRSIMTADLRVISIVSNLGRSLSEGEIKQLESADEIIIDEENYLQVIKKKTAVLLSACAEIGAITSGAPQEFIEKSRLFGECLGYAFQIKDDIFDYFNDSNIGKPTGNDIREGKITLPLLHAIQTATPQEANSCLDIIKSRSFSSDNVNYLIAFAKHARGIDYATRRMNFYRDQAISVLRAFPDSPARDSLMMLTDYIVERSK